MPWLLWKLSYYENFSEHGHIYISLLDPDFKSFEFIPSSRLLTHEISMWYFYFFNFWGNIILFSIKSPPFYILNNSEHGSQFLQRLSNLWCYFFFISDTWKCICINNGNYEKKINVKEIVSIHWDAKKWGTWWQSYNDTQIRELNNIPI